jgi:hypothetical protein
MNKIFLFLTIIIFIFAQPTFAEENLCEEAGLLVDKTKVQANEIFEERYRGRHYKGVGYVNDVEKSGSRARYVRIKVDCQNDVIIKLVCRHAGLAEDYDIGQNIFFMGECRKMKKGVYLNTGSRYVLITMEDVSVGYK